MAAAEFHFYSKLFADLDTALATYISDTASNIIGAITPVATTLLTIYLALWGWATIRGVIHEPILDSMVRMVRLTLITAAAINLGYYNAFLVDFLWNSPDALAAYVGGSDSTTNVAYLDSIMSMIYDFGDAYYQKAYATTSYGIPSLGLLFCAYAVWLAGGAVTAYGAFLFALGKMALAITLGIGPIFVLLLLFEPTKRFFDAWIGQALNYVFLVMLSAAAVRLIVTILETYLVVASPTVLADPALNQAIPGIAFAVIGVLVLMQMPSKASALGGGVAVGTLGAAGYAWSKLSGSSRSTLSSMRPTNMRRSLNRARADYRIAKGAVGATVGAPGAIYRKITGGNRNRIARAS